MGRNGSEGGISTNEGDESGVGEGLNGEILSSSSFVPSGGTPGGIGGAGTPGESGAS